jgi:hypothetical protein
VTCPVVCAILARVMFGLSGKALVGCLLFPCSAACIATIVNALLLWQRIRKISRILTLGNPAVGRIASVQSPEDGEKAIEITTACDIDGNQIVRKHRICSFCELGGLKVGDSVTVLATGPTASEGLIADLLFPPSEAQRGNHAWWRFWS